MLLHPPSACVVIYTREGKTKRAAWAKARASAKCKDVPGAWCRRSIYLCSALIVDVGARRRDGICA